jgi:Bacterial Ig-like domain (group 2)/IgA Peptidase M64
MALNVVLPLSTCDIHLVRSGTANANTFRMVVVADNTANNISNDANTSLIGFNAAIATAAKVGGANPHILFTGVAAGETIGKVVHLDTSVTPNVSFEFLVRIRVHQSLSAFWIGNNQITVHQGMNNYVTSVYASFSDGTRGDISGHPYVSFSSNAAAATVDSEGRLTGVSAGSATISVTVGTTTQTINVRVVGPVTTNRPIVERIHGSGLFSDRRNILFLGEGFSNIADFEKITSEIKDRIMFTVSHSPYNALRDSFNIWTACEPQDHPSPEDGVTFAVDVRIPTTAATKQVPVGNPVPPAGENPIGPLSQGRFTLLQLVGLVGLPTSWLPSPPTTLAQALTAFGTLRNFDGTTKTFTAVHAAALDQPTLEAWLELRDHGPLQARNSKLGVVHGGRLGERRAVAAVLPHKNLWYFPDVAHRSVSIDQRRRDSAFSFITFIEAYLKSLKLAGAAANDPNFAIGNTWAGGGKDSGLGCLIVNDGYLGGSRFGSVGAPISLFASTVNVHTQLTVPTPTPANSTVLNHTPPNAASVPFEVITLVLSHELAHALNLLDEYEGADFPHHSTVNNASPQEIQDLHASSNATPFQDIQSLVTAGRIDPSRAKWNLDRIALASPLAAQASGNNSNSITVQLRPKQGSRWQNVMTQQRQVFLRDPDLTRDPTNANLQPLGPLTIDQSSNLAADTLTLKLPPSTTTSATFSAGSTLYLPQRDKNNVILRVIHPSVIAHIRANGSFAPQAPGTCERFSFAAENPPANIANFTLPAVAADTVGVYEGGGTWTCRVFRPCGNCRMRNFDATGRQQIRFCFVCKYTLVNLIDPSVHHIIDPLYP